MFWCGFLSVSFVWRAFSFFNWWVYNCFNNSHPDIIFSNIFTVFPYFRDSTYTYIKWSPTVHQFSAYSFPSQYLFFLSFMLCGSMLSLLLFTTSTASNLLLILCRGIFHLRYCAFSSINLICVFSYFPHHRDHAWTFIYFLLKIKKKFSPKVIFFNWF